MGNLKEIGEIGYFVMAYSPSHLTSPCIALASQSSIPTSYLGGGQHHKNRLLFTFHDPHLRG